MRTVAVPFHFTQLGAQGRSWFDIADDGGQNFIQRAARDFQELLNREAVRIAESIGFALCHVDFPLMKKGPP